MIRHRTAALAAAMGGAVWACFASFGAPAARAGSAQDEVKMLVRISADANAALMRGDLARYLDLLSLSEDFTLMSPFGGEPSYGAEYTPERLERMARFFRNGVLEQEVVATYRSNDLIVLATRETANVEVGGLPAQDWRLRVTQVYRRDGRRWRLVHRHADPLVADVSLPDAAALARRPLKAGPEGDGATPVRPAPAPASPARPAS